MMHLHPPQDYAYPTLLNLTYQDEPGVMYIHASSERKDNALEVVS